MCNCNSGNSLTTTAEKETAAMIDIHGIYIVTFENGQKRNIDGKAFLNCYFLDELNRPSVKAYERKEGVWYDVKFNGVKQWAVYAKNEQEAIQARMDDLINLGYADLTKLSASPSSFA